MQILPVAKRVARWMAILGLICGVLYSFGGLAYDLTTTGLNRGTALAFLALLGMPLAFGLVGFVLGALGALVARGVGGARGRTPS